MRLSSGQVADEILYVSMRVLLVLDIRTTSDVYIETADVHVV